MHKVPRSENLEWYTPRNPNHLAYIIQKTIQKTLDLILRLKRPISLWCTVRFFLIINYIIQLCLITNLLKIFQITTIGWQLTSLTRWPEGPLAVSLRSHIFSFRLRISYVCVLMFPQINIGWLIDFFIAYNYLLVLLVCHSRVSRCSFSDINVLERFEAMGSSRSSPLICLH